MCHFADQDVVEIANNLNAEPRLTADERKALRELTDQRIALAQDIPMLVLCIRRLRCSTIQVAVVRAVRDLVDDNLALASSFINLNLYREFVLILQECPRCAVEMVHLIRQLIEYPAIFNQMFVDSTYIYLQQMLSRPIPQEVIDACLWALTTFLIIVKGNHQRRAVVLDNVDVVARFGEVYERRIMQLPEHEREPVLFNWASLLAMLVSEEQIIQANYARPGFQLALQVIRW